MDSWKPAPGGGGGGGGGPAPGGGRRLDGALDPKILSPKLGSDLLARPIESISYVAGHLIWGMTGWVETN